jgi:tRNA(fMet)-specific endonuclease VapC
MSFLLDTNICSAYIKGNKQVFNRFIQHGGRLSASVITVGELVIWAARGGAPSKRQQDVDDLLQLVRPLDVTMDVARKFGELQASFLDIGLPSPELDLIIGSTALVHDLTLVTHNVQDFVNIPGLRIVDWMLT